MRIHTGSPLLVRKRTTPAESTHNSPLARKHVPDSDPGWPAKWSSRVRNSCRTGIWHLVVHGKNVVRGLVPRWGGGGARQNPRSQFAVPSHNSVSSYLGGPATAGMTDRCESMSRTPIRDALKWLASAPANASIRHSREGGNPRTNIPRKKANRDTTTCVQTATPLRLSGKNRPRTPIRAGNPDEVEGRQK